MTNVIIPEGYTAFVQAIRCIEKGTGSFKVNLGLQTEASRDKFETIVYMFNLSQQHTETSGSCQ